jgi:hypothetical protein
MPAESCRFLRNTDGGLLSGRIEAGKAARRHLRRFFNQRCLPHHITTAARST